MGFGFVLGGGEGNTRISQASGEERCLVVTIPRN